MIGGLMHASATPLQVARLCLADGQMLDPSLPYAELWCVGWRGGLDWFTGLELGTLTVNCWKCGGT